MSIIQVLSQNIPVFYGLLGLAIIWLAYEIRRTIKERRMTWPTKVWATEEAGWTIPSPEQAWKPKAPQPPPKNEMPQIKATAETDPLKQFFQKEHVTEPITTDINRPRKGQA